MRKQSPERQFSQTDATSEILKHLGDPEVVEISNTPKIILLAPSFSKEITTTVLWLNQQGLQIRCFQARPYQLDEKIFLNVGQIIPLPEAEDFLVSLGRKAQKVEQQQLAANKRGMPTLRFLESAGRLQIDTPLFLLKMPRANMSIPDENARRATFIGNDRVRWQYDNEVYSLTALVQKIWQMFSPHDTKPLALNGTDYWSIEGDSVTLY